MQRYSLQASADGSEVLLTETQVWYPNGTHPGRDAQSQHNFTVRLDDRLGYVVDASLFLRINVSARNVEFTNWLPTVLANPWPVGQWGPGADVDGRPYFDARGTATVWPVPGSAPDAHNYTGFTENMLAGAWLGRRRSGVSADFRRDFHRLRLPPPPSCLLLTLALFSLLQGPC